MSAKFLSLLLAAALLLCPLGAHAATQTASGLFSISYDETCWQADSASYHAEDSAQERWLFMLYSQNMLIDVEVLRAADYAVENLTDATLQQYIDEMVFVGCRYVDTLHADGVPFGLFELEDEEGPYLLAETVVNGWCIDFYAYYDQTAPVDDALVQALREIVGTYQPCR